MKYIVVEEFNDEIQLAHQDGEPFVTEELEEAEDLLSQLQGGYVLPLANIIKMSKYFYESAALGTLDTEEVKFEMKQILGK